MATTVAPAARASAAVASVMPPMATSTGPCQPRRAAAAHRPSQSAAWRSAWSASERPGQWRSSPPAVSRIPATSALLPPPKVPTMPLRSQQLPSLGGLQIACVHMNAVKANLLNQIGPVIENQLHLSGRQRRAQNLCIGQQLSLRAGLVAVLQQRDAGISQFAAQPAQKLRRGRRME